MSEKLSYEEMMRRKLEEISMPDENASWEKMNALLDDDDKHRRIIPPIYLRSCLAVSFVLLLTAALGWYFFMFDKKEEKKNDRVATINNQQPIKNGRGGEVQNNPAVPLSKIAQPSESANIVPGAENESTANKITLQLNQTRNDRTANALTIKAGKTKAEIPLKDKNRNNRIVANNVSDNLSATSRSRKKTAEQTKAAIAKTIKTWGAANNTQLIFQNPEHTFIHRAPHKIAAATDSVGIEVKKPGSKKGKSFSLSAGIGLQQGIPLGSQSVVPYNYYGRTGSLYDYIPSLYLRLHKKEKWFVQAEFRFGAPQSLKEFAFSRQTKFDVFTNNITTTSLRLKKTYYHQLPLSFNYNLNKNLSVGAGAMYSYFYGAVTEQETVNKNVQTGVETFSTTFVPVKGFTDSFLYKTQVHFLLQTNYQWKRFSLGLRYTNDLQPYIKYTLPDGSLRTEKNHSLQMILRYRLWQGKKF